MVGRQRFCVLRSNDGVTTGVRVEDHAGDPAGFAGKYRIVVFMFATRCHGMPMTVLAISSFSLPAAFAIVAHCGGFLRTTP